MDTFTEQANKAFDEIFEDYTGPVSEQELQNLTNSLIKLLGQPNSNSKSTGFSVEGWFMNLVFFYGLAQAAEQELNKESVKFRSRDEFIHFIDLLVFTAFNNAVQYSLWSGWTNMDKLNVEPYRCFNAILNATVLDPADTLTIDELIGRFIGVVKCYTLSIDMTCTALYSSLETLIPENIVAVADRKNDFFNKELPYILDLHRDTFSNLFDRARNN